MDRLFKMRYLVQCKDDIDAVGLVDIFIPHIASKQELSDNIFSDRGP